MAKKTKFLLIFGLSIVLTLSVSCRDLPKFKLSTPSVSYSTLDETQEKPSDEEYSIQLVQWSLTKELPPDKNMWKALKYGIGYVVNYTDKGFWYVENEVVYNLNDLACQYCENNKQYYGIKWGKLFGIATADSEEEKPASTIAETAIQEETAISEETTAASEETAISEETTAAASSSVFKFFYFTTLPKIWGNSIRIVEPPLINFSGVFLDVRPGEIEISGNIAGNSYINYCTNPDSGIYTLISAVIINQDGDVEWQQDGTAYDDAGEVSFIRSNDVKSFSLTNSYINTVNIGDSLIIIAYTKGSMPEDSAVINANIDKCIYGSYVGTLK
jgi:hypothetical protein